MDMMNVRVLNIQTHVPGVSKKYSQLIKRSLKLITLIINMSQVLDSTISSLNF